MAVLLTDPGGDATFDLLFWSGVTGTVTADQTLSHTGPCAFKFASGVGNAAASMYRVRLADAGRRISCWFRFDSLPLGPSDILTLRTSGGVTVFALQLRSDGKLQTAAGALSTTALAANTWYRIGLSYTIASAATNSFRVTLNGGLEISVTNSALSATGTSHFLIGWTNGGALPGANKSCWFDDLYIDDLTDLTDPGAIRVTAKRPNALSTNTFGGAIGSYTNRWDLVNERPANNAHYWYLSSYPQSEIYGIESATQGDVDVSGATVVAYTGWIWAVVPLSTPNEKLTVNGIDYAIAGTGTDSFFIQPVGAVSYPASGAGVGLKQTDAVGIARLYECGMLIAYIPATGPPAAPAGLTATGGNAQVALSWSASSGATSYNLKRSTTAGSGYATVQSGLTGVSTIDTGVLNGTTYYYVVSAVSSGGESANSSQVAATPAAPTTAPTFMDPGGDATYDFGLWKAAEDSGGILPVVDLTVSHTGPASFKYDSGTNGYCDSYVACLADAGRRISAAVRFSALPTGAADFLLVASASGFNYITGVRLRSDGKLQLAGDSTAVGTTALAANTWYRVALSYTITSTTVNSFRVYLNGNLEITKNNVTLPIAASSWLFCGWPYGAALPGAGKQVWFDDIWVDDSSALSDPGDIRVTAKRPNALAINTFGNATGSFTNRWDLINERPANTAHYWSLSAYPQSEVYGIESAAQGDVSLGAAAVQGYLGWLLAYLPSSATNAKLTLNGSDHPISPSGLVGPYMKPLAASSYPVSGSGIGLKYTDTVGIPNLYECGVLVGYIPSALTTLMPTGRTLGSAAGHATASGQWTGAATARSASALPQSATRQSPRPFAPAAPLLAARPVSPTRVSPRSLAPTARALGTSLPARIIAPATRLPLLSRTLAASAPPAGSSTVRTATATAGRVHAQTGGAQTLFFGILPAFSARVPAAVGPAGITGSLALAPSVRTLVTVVPSATRTLAPRLLIASAAAAAVFAVEPFLTLGALPARALSVALAAPPASRTATQDLAPSVRLLIASTGGRAVQTALTLTAGELPSLAAILVPITRPPGVQIMAATGRVLPARTVAPAVLPGPITLFARQLAAAVRPGPASPRHSAVTLAAAALAPLALAVDAARLEAATALLPAGAVLGLAAEPATRTRLRLFTPTPAALLAHFDPPAAQGRGTVLLPAAAVALALETQAVAVASAVARGAAARLLALANPEAGLIQGTPITFAIGPLALGLEILPATRRLFGVFKAIILVGDRPTARIHAAVEPTAIIGVPRSWEAWLE